MYVPPLTWGTKQTTEEDMEGCLFQTTALETEGAANPLGYNGVWGLRVEERIRRL